MLIKLAKQLRRMYSIQKRTTTTTTTASTTKQILQQQQNRYNNNVNKHNKHSIEPVQKWCIIIETKG